MNTATADDIFRAVHGGHGMDVRCHPDCPGWGAKISFEDGHVRMEGPSLEHQGRRAEGPEEWWMRTAREDYEQTVPKILEYGGATDGSVDLKLMGQALCHLLGWDDSDLPVAQELACWLYTLGKVGRLISDYHNRKPGKPDTWFDIGVYAKMARRIQETGRWP